MYAGRLLETGSLGGHHERRPRTPTPRGLLHSFPSLRGPRRELAGIPGSPPDLRDPPPGCPFIPRCGFADARLRAVDMTLEPTGARCPAPAGHGHLTACPIVTPEVSQEGVLS